MSVVDDILDWSATKLSGWKQDALRRFACGVVLSAQDEDELLAMLKEAAGFVIAKKAPAPIPLATSHLAAVSGGPNVSLKGVRKVKNVNRLIPAAEINFSPKLTVVYGRNGSGKSGFVRILRTACRTRVDNPAKLKVLADVYGPSKGPQEAEIVVDHGSGDVPITWTAGAPAADVLARVAVFDSAAAQVYVDGGNQIQFLPFGLALPHKLNELCIKFKTLLDAERKQITDKLPLTQVPFDVSRSTTAQAFNSGISAKTSDAEIAAATGFLPEDQKRLDELVRILGASTSTSADLTAFSKWLSNVANECVALETALSDEQLEASRQQKAEAVAARQAASSGADTLFASEPLQGVGGETWRRLWLAARDYATQTAYPGQEFPTQSDKDKLSKCVLCHQDLNEAASQRMGRFHAFVSGALAAAADKAEVAVASAISSVPELALLNAKDWADRINQILKRDADLSTAVTSFKATAEQRRTALLSALKGDDKAAPTPAPMPSCHSLLQKLSEVVAAEAVEMAKSTDVAQRAVLLEEHNQLADRKVLQNSMARLTERRDLLKTDALYVTALAEVQTKGITQKANELIDTHLTTAVSDQFDAERTNFEINHLKIGLARKSGQTKATFQTDPGTTLTKLSSDILSEGEQRALALAAFMTEVTVTDGSGPIVIDDPVSSLDRERGLKVATRISKEAAIRQVIVFTHDIVFFNDLCAEADKLGVQTETISLFSDASHAGHRDPAGVSWKGLSVSKRLARLKNDFAPLRKLHGTSPSDYEIKLKGLYGRLRDCYERLVEEHIFCDVVRRGVDRIETQKLRHVHLSDDLAIRFHEGMTKANTFSHDNPEVESVAIPKPDEFDTDLSYVEALVADLVAAATATEAKRPTMKPKKN